MKNPNQHSMTSEQTAATDRDRALEIIGKECAGFDALVKAWELGRSEGKTAGLAEGRTNHYWEGYWAGFHDPKN